jgi:hypothetical protein
MDEGDNGAYAEVNSSITADDEIEKNLQLNLK